MNPLFRAAFIPDSVDLAQYKALSLFAIVRPLLGSPFIKAHLCRNGN